MRIEVTQIEPSKDEPKRRWFQFRLRTLLVVLALLSVLFGWSAKAYHEVRKRSDAVRDMESLGAIVWYDDEVTFKDTLFQDGMLFLSYRERRWYEQWFGVSVFRVPACITLEKEHVPIEFIRSLPRMPELRAIVLKRVRSQTGLAQFLGEMPKLEFVGFVNAEVRCPETQELQQTLPECRIVYWTETHTR